jgi:nucleoside-triphosphatase THEP1
MISSRIVLLTGGFESGKTSLCLAVAQTASEAGWEVAGVLSPAVFTGDEKTGIDLLDPKTGQRCNLAVRRDQAQSNLETRRWSFLPECVAWGSQLLRDAVPCDLLLVDELGPIEFTQNRGWVEAFDAIKSGLYRTALLVIRPWLLEQAAGRWNISRVIDLDDPLQHAISAQELLEGEGLLPGSWPGAPGIFPEGV